MTKTENKRDKANAQRRRQILDAAFMCFLENGYHQTGVREIAKRAGISLGNLYNHFSGKHDVLAEIATLERAELEPFLNLLAQEKPADAVLAEFVTGYAEYLSSPENVILTLEITCEALRKPDIAVLFTESRTALVTAVIGLIERGVREGSLTAVADVEETAHLLIELIEGRAYRAAIDGAPLKRVLAGLREFVSAALVARNL
ncbi:MAG: TetR/AcrR family transcriptional regulator [Pseudomonadota bacterium]